MYKEFIKEMFIGFFHLIKLFRTSLKRRKESNLDDHFIKLGQDFDNAFQKIKRDI